MALSPQDAIKLNNYSPTFKDARVGTVLVKTEKATVNDITPIASVNIATPVLIDFEITADATSGLAIFDGNCPFNMTIASVLVEAKATSGGGTAKLTDGTNDITDAIVCAVDKATTFQATLDDAYSTLAKNDSLKVVTANSADRGKVTIIARRND